MIFIVFDISITTGGRLIAVVPAYNGENGTDSGLFQLLKFHNG